VFFVVCFDWLNENECVVIEWVVVVGKVFYEVVEVFDVY